MDHNHKILIVGDEKKVVASLKPILYMENINISFAADGETGLRKINGADPPFSLVISDQRLSGIQGTAFLAQAKNLAPHTIRYLIARYADMETIIDSVNRGAVHRYISVTWTKKEFMTAVSRGLKQYEAFLADEAHLAEARKLNKKLYRLDCNLMESSRHQDRELAELDRDIEAVKRRIRLGVDPDTDALDRQVFKEMEAALVLPDGVDRGKLAGFHAGAVQKIFREFQEIAAAAGMAMPGPGEEG